LKGNNKKSNGILGLF